MFQDVEKIIIILLGKFNIPAKYSADIIGKLSDGCIDHLMKALDEDDPDKKLPYPLSTAGYSS